jgi:ABC-type branched-subunit amino acid transport system substrate-binding protein
VKVGLILPLTGPGQGSVAATSMKNAAELALAEFQNPDLAILLKDDRGTPDGAREAAEQAIARVPNS